MKTDNSFIEVKTQLRLEVVGRIGKDSVKVLDCYAEKGVLWDELSKRTDKRIEVFSIEKERNKNPKAVCGDNMKVIMSLDLDAFDIIDLDAYGIPFRQLEVLRKRRYHGFVVVTAIQSVMGQIPYSLLIANGITRKMIVKCPLIFSQKGLGYLENYLYLCGCQSIKGYFIDRKNYFYYQI